MPTFSWPPDLISHLHDFAHKLVALDFDLLLLGDGSGTVYNRPAGWGCIAYDARKQQATIHAGALSTGTNNLAELLPYVQALWHHHQDHKQAPVPPVRVLIVSDSEVTVRCGNGYYARRANAALWASIQWFADNGYRLAWKHVPRNSNAWNTAMDTLAGQMRLLLANEFKKLLTDNVPLPEPVTPNTNDVNLEPRCGNEVVPKP